MDKKAKNRLVKLATYFSVANASIIIVIKLFAWGLTDSVSILASLVDSVLDVVASTINLIAVRYALQPADDDHRFGHEKIQDLAVFAQSIFFMASGIFVILSALRRFNKPVDLGDVDIGIIVMIASTILTIILLAYQTYVIKVTKSNIIAADKLHYSVDVLSNIAVIISLYVTAKYQINYVDPVFAIIISFYIIRGAYQLFKEAYLKLIDTEFSDDDKAKILHYLSYRQEILGVHELKTRYAGNKAFIQFHMELDRNLSFVKAHAISEQVAADIRRLFPDCEVMIHQDPSGEEGEFKFKETI